MDGRDSIALSGSSPSYYLHRGINISNNLQTPTVFRPSTPNPNFQFQSNLRENNNNSDGSQFRAENTVPDFSQGLNMSMVPSIGSSSNETVKKKRGRPRKYGPDGTNVALGLSPMSGTPQSGPTTPKTRGRPRGSGWRQKLAPLGEWMNSSAGLAFTPHVIHIDVGDDIAAKILAFAQHRPRALCIMTGHGAVSAVTLRQLTPAATTITYEGRFQILCLSGSYLVADSGVRNRTGGISVSLCSADGHVIGGGVSELIAASPVQVVVCSFVYGGPKSKNKEIIANPEIEEKNPMLLSGEVTAVTPPNNSTNQIHTPKSSTTPTWPVSRPDTYHPQRDFDLTRG